MDNTKGIYFKRINYIHKKCMKAKKKIEEENKIRFSTKPILIKRKENNMNLREKISNLEDGEIKDILDLMANQINANKNDIHSILGEIDNIKQELN